MKFSQIINSIKLFFNNFFELEKSNTKELRQSVHNEDKIAQQNQSSFVQVKEPNVKEIKLENTHQSNKSNNANQINQDNFNQLDNYFLKQLNHRLNVAKKNNVSLEPIQSPGVIINTDLKNSNNQAIKIYVYNDGQNQLTLSDNGYVWQDVHKKHPQLQLDEYQLKQAGIYVDHSNKPNFYVHSSMSHFIYDFGKMINVIKMLEQ